MLKYLKPKIVLFSDVSFLFWKPAIMVVEIITSFDLEIFAVCIL